MLFLLWFSTTVCEGRLCERLKIYSGKYLFYKSATKRFSWMDLPS
jgi:hypothetical protein